MKSHLAVFAFLAVLQSGSAQDLAEISGKVIDSSSKLPLAGVRVVLFRWGEGASFMYDTVDKAEPMAQPQDPKSPVFSMLTGDDGRFSFKTTPSYFSLYAKSRGYVGWGDDSATRRFLTLKPGQKVADILIAMDMPGSISGRVIDPETGKPVPGLAVTPMAWQISDGSRALVFAGEAATSDKNGVYEIKGLSPGEYVLQIGPSYGEKFEPGGNADEFRANAQRSYVRSYYPGVERREQAQTLILLPGAPLERIDFKLARHKAAAIRGCVRSDLESDQLGDVRLGLMSIEVQGTTTSYGTAAADKTVRGGDCFRLEGLSPGSYCLIAVAASTNPAETRQAFAFLDLDDQRMDNVDLNLMKGVPIHGKVRLDETLAADAPKDMRLKVSLSLQGRAFIEGEGEALEVSAADGSFTLPDVFPGSYRINVQGLPKGIAVGELRYNGARAGRNLMTTNPGAPDQRLEVVLLPATGSLSVTVEGGAKSADSQLVLLPDVQGGLDLMWDPRAVKADSEGHGSFANLLAGKYRVFAFVPRATWRTDPAFVQQMIAAQDVEVSNGAAQIVEVKLTQLQ